MSGDEQIAEVFDERLPELETQWVAGQAPYTKSTPYGMSKLTDEQFLVWFHQNTQKNPWWPLALQFVEGGEDEYKRFERLMARAQAGGMQPMQEAQ